MSNLLNAVYHIISQQRTEIRDFNSGRNRINSVGYALENYIKDIFAHTFDEQNETDRNFKFSQVFSYLGYSN